MTTFNEDDFGFDGGDPRCCKRHPWVVIGSPDGLYDGLCGECESQMNEAADPIADYARECGPDMPFTPCADDVALEGFRS